MVGQGEYLFMLTREQERENIFQNRRSDHEINRRAAEGWSSPGVRPR